MVSDTLYRTIKKQQTVHLLITRRDEQPFSVTWAWHENNATTFKHNAIHACLLIFTRKHYVSSLMLFFNRYCMKSKLDLQVLFSGKKRIQLHCLLRDVPWFFKKSGEKGIRHIASVFKPLWNYYWLAWDLMGVSASHVPRILPRHLVLSPAEVLVSRVTG